MAFRDWNNDGKKDWQDDYLEFSIFKKAEEERMKQNNIENNTNNFNYNYGGNGISNTGAVIAVILDVIISLGICALLGLEDTLMVVVFLILVVVIGAILAVLFDNIGL